MDTAPTIFIPATEYAVTQTVRGRRDRLAAIPGVTRARVASAPPPSDYMALEVGPEFAAFPLLRYVCALNGWEVVSVAGDKIIIDCNRIGAQVVEIDPVHGSGFAEGAYYGGPGAWGGYGVRDAAGPWYRFTVVGGLQPCSAEDAIAALTRSAERHCAGDRDFIAEIVSF